MTFIHSLKMVDNRGLLAREMCFSQYLCVNLDLYIEYIYIIQIGLFCILV